MDVIGIIQLLIPVITFAMGYFLTNIGYKRDRKLSIMREKFEKLYHPFYLLLHELGTDTKDGEALELGAEGYSGFKPFFDHLKYNMYLASPEGQKLFWETRKLFYSCTADSERIDEEKDLLFGQSFGALCEYLLLEYVKAAKALGYELDAEEHTGITES